MVHVLTVDDEPLIGKLIKNLLQELFDYECIYVPTNVEALKILRENKIELVLLDVYLIQEDGLDLLNHIRKHQWPIDVIIITGHPDLKLAIKALRLGADDFLTKPFTVKEFKQTVENHISKRHPTAKSLAFKLETYIEYNCSDVSLNLGKISNEFSISQTYICKLFEENYQSTFRKRLAYYRIKKAKDLLIETNLPLYLIAEACGFKNQVRFTETFIRLERMPPKEFRNRNKKENNIIG